MTWLLDLDGVVWLADRPIDGAADAIGRLRKAGERVVFATNNSWARLADQESKLERMGIPAAGDVVTSAMAAANLVTAGERVLVAGGPGVVEAVDRRGA
jgi:glycerol-1-phosphatase